jgi:hypothetical protein
MDSRDALIVGPGGMATSSWPCLPTRNMATQSRGHATTPAETNA